MQKVLDRTTASLANAFASLAESAKRQRRAYLAATGALMLLVVIVALLLAALAAKNQLDYRRVIAIQNARDISLLLHREALRLRNAEFTLDYYHDTANVLPVDNGIEASIRRDGYARGTVDRLDASFDLLVDDATRAAWGPQLGTNLWRLYEATRATLTSQLSDEPARRAMLIGLTRNYAAIMPSLGQATNGGASSPPPLRPAIIGTLREGVERELLAQTGERLPRKGEQVWVGPYRDPLQGRRVVSAVSVYYDGDRPSVLIVMSIPVDVLAAHLERPTHEGSLLLTTAAHRLVVASPPLGAVIEAKLLDLAARSPSGKYLYTRDGVVLSEPLTTGLGSLVGYISWPSMLAILSGQLTLLAGAALLILLAIAAMSRFWGLRLLRKTFEETSRALQSETLNHVLVSATPVGLCIVRQGNYSIITANEPAVALLKLEPGGARLPAHIVGEFSAHAQDPASSAELTTMTAFVAPAQALPAGDSAAGGGRFLQFTYAPARYAGEDVLFCAILDVTAQHELEQQLRLAQQTSDAMLRARSNFFASMSHEIRTPLNALLGNLELFARTPGLDAHAQRLGTLNVAADALRRIVDDILDFSKIDAGEMKLVSEPFRLIDAFENIALSYAPIKADQAIRFYALLSPTLDCVMQGDRTRIAQIVNNLLSNAFKFTLRGKIVLTAQLQDDAHGRPVLVCRVSDSGIGMDQALVARVFRPFEQGDPGTSSRFGGTGLGLSICERLCKLMGGHIDVESVAGVGSAFSVSIPLTAVHDASAKVASDAPAHRGSVLVVCQEPDAGELIGEWLQRAGWTAHAVTSVDSARSRLQASRPDALVMTGEYSLDELAELRAVQATGVAWITRSGPHRPVVRADGVLEVTSFSHAAILAAVELAASGANLTDHADLSESGKRAPPPPPAFDPALRGLKVLIAEDNPLIQTLIVEQLDTLGCAPTITKDGREALAAFDAATFDVVLTDIHMPLMDGHELLDALHRLNAGLPVLAFTAVTDQRQNEGWLERGFDGCVAKPASLSELEAALLAVVAGRTPSPAEAAQPATALNPHDKARFTAMLRTHLQSDLPKLLTIVDEENQQSLRDWAHSASGAFMVVQETQFAHQCRELQRLCDRSESWTTEMDERAISLHEALCDRFGLDEASTH
ncbi:two-component system capsular synthesis sensor histidine kinase RcsC [Paraburkholderia sp. GAS199]|uniref:ATP-binding protein n=1 Tax=Paraburkholderia sp. GAS199 TaxID=3035126 RepID=UPI003D1975D1